VKFSPKAYQVIGAKFLYEHPRCNLWATPGMGKTSMVLMLLDWLKLAGSAFFPVLVIAPKRVCELVWPAEIAKWDDFKDLRVSLILGTARQRADALVAPADIYIINFDNVQWLVKELGDKWPFKIVAADESTRLKSFRLRQGGARAQSLSRIARHVGRWINLTGTPSPNGLSDLWGPMWFVDFGQRLGASYTAFMRRWFSIDMYTHAVTPLACADKEIHEAIADCTLALRAEDWFDIHQPVVTEVPVKLPDAAMKLYKEMERDFYIELDATGITAVNAMAKSMKCLQLASGSVYDANHIVHEVHNAKLEGLQSVIDEMGGEPIIVVFWFKFDAYMLQNAFPKARLYDGKRTEDEWNAGKIQMLLLQPASAGHGVNLQHGGRCIVFWSYVWDLDMRYQPIERLGPTRQLQSGYTRAVLVYDLVALGTLDEAVLSRLDGKKSVQDSLMDARAQKS
jgi:SNF2 family DNA or RNA helicase